MRTARLLAVAAATLASLPLMAQQVNATAQQNASASAAGMHANQSADAAAHANLSRNHAQANTSAAAAAQAEARHGSARANAWGSAAERARLRPVTGQLQGKLDAKTAKVGQRVVLKTTEKIRTADGVVIPRGSRLIGHVTEVQAHSRGHEQSSLGIAFDRAELKNGQSFAIHSVIEAVRPSPAELEAASMANDDTMAGPAGGSMAGSAMPGGSAMAAGGVGAVGGATSAIGAGTAGIASPVSGAPSAVGGAMGATGNLAANTTGDLDRGVYGSARGASSLSAHASTLPGVMLDSNAAADASGTFTAARRNVHLDSGTQMVVGLAATR